MWDIIKAGGLIMAPMMLMWLVCIGIIAERFWTLRKSTVLPPALGPQVRQYAKTHKLEAAQLQELADNSALGEVLSTILSNRHRSRDVIRQQAEDAGRRAVHELHRFLNALGTIAIISPLMGLLGTVFGLIRMFSVVTLGDAQKLSVGIGEALVATAAGLIVAIVAYIAHRYFRAVIADLAVELEREASLLIDTLESPVAATSARPATAKS